MNIGKLGDLDVDGRTHPKARGVYLFNLFNLSSFTISEANYRLTLGYHGIASSFLLIITYILFY